MVTSKASQWYLQDNFINYILATVQLAFLLITSLLLLETIWGGLALFVNWRVFRCYIISKQALVER